MIQVCMQVTCVGPAGLGGQLTSLQHIFHWAHPAVSVAEFSDMDTGDAAYDDVHITVFALTSAALSWQPPPLLRDLNAKGALLFRCLSRHRCLLRHRPAEHPTKASA